MIARRTALPLALLLVAGAAAAQTRTGSLSEARLAAREAKALSKVGKHVEAEVQYRKAIQLDPQLTEAYEGLSNSLFVQRKHGQAVTLLREALGRLQGSDPLEAQLAMHLYRQRKYDEAYKLFKASVAALPKRYATQAVAGQCCLQQQDHRCAKEAFERFLAHRPASLARQDLPIRVGLARALFGLGKPAKARAELGRAQAIKRDYPPAMALSAEIALDQGDCARATSLYEQLQRRLQAGFAPLRLQFARACLCARRYRQASAVASRLLRDRPDDIEARLVLGDAAAGLGRTDQALAAFRAVARKRDTAEIRLRIARVLLRERRNREVLSLLADDLKRGDAAEELLVAGIRATVRTGGKARALELARRIAGRGGATPRGLYYAAIAHNSSGDFARATELLGKVLEREPRHLGARRELIRANCYLARRELRGGKLEAAAARLEGARKLAPRSLAVNRNLALVLFRLERHGPALKRINVVLNKVPRDLVANRLAGRINARLGKLERAQRHFDAAVRAVVRHRGAALARALLESAALQMRQNKLERAKIELRQARKVTRGKKISKQLRQALAHATAGAWVASASAALDRGKGKAAWQDLGTALEVAGNLSAEARRSVLTAAALGAFFTGRVDAGQKLLRRIGRRPGPALRAPFDRLGRKLLAALAARYAPAAAAQLRAATQLRRLAARVKGSARETLGQLAAATYHAAAQRLARGGRHRQALAAMTAASRIKGAPKGPKVQHNLAVLQYHTGQKAAALAKLRALRGRVPMASCNLAAHAERSSSYREAYRHFAECARRGAAYPGIERIVASKRRVLGKVGQ